MKKFNLLLIIFIELLVLLIPFYIFRFKIEAIRTNIFEVSVFILFLLFVIQKIINGQITKIRLGGVLPLLFLAVVLFSVTKSENYVTGLGIFKGWFLSPYLFYLLIINTFDRDSLPYLSIPLYCSLILVSFWAYLQSQGIFSVLFYQAGDISFDQYLSQKRFFGPFESPNFLAMYLVPVFFLSLPILKHIKNFIVKIVVGLSFLVPLYAVYLTGSRGGFIAFVLSTLIFIFLFNWPALKTNIISLSVSKVCAVVIINAVYFLYFIKTKFPEVATSDKIRQEIYNYTIGLLKTNWPTGIGLGNFQSKIQTISSSNNSFVEYGLPYALHPHNLLFAVWINLGLGGLIVFLLLIGGFFKQIFSSKPNIIRASIGAAMASILIHGIFDTSYFKNDLSAIFWLILAFPVLFIKDKGVKGLR